MSGIIFLAAFFLAAVLDIVIAVAVLRTKDKGAHGLAYAFFSGAFISLTYVASIYSPNYLAMSVFSSLYFIGVDCALRGFLLFLVNISGLRYGPVTKVVVWATRIYFVVDVAMMLFSPFFGEFALSYIPVDPSIGLYAYDPHLPFEMHLAYCYLLVAFAVMLLIYKIGSVPSIYKMRFAFYLVGFAVITALNAAYLFFPVSGLANYDYSILLYSFLGMYIYYVHFHYLDRAVKIRAASLAINQLGSGIMLFDYKGTLVSLNKEAEFLIPEDRRNRTTTIYDFIEEYGLDQHIANVGEETTFIWSFGKDGKSYSFRVRYRVATDRKGVVCAHVFTLTDNSLEMDPLTGFATQASGARTIKSAVNPLPLPCAVAAFDIERLSAINDEHGMAMGDECIKLLAQTMRSVFPANTFFFRHVEATLIAVAPNTNTYTARNCVFSVIEKMRAQDVLPVAITVQGCSEIGRNKNEALSNVVRKTLSGLRAQKLLSQGSTHAALISTLMQMQRQSDGETAEHIRRTRLLCSSLGNRLNLSDSEMGRLELLCMLHDVGNVGIPVEILNNPRTLTEVELDIVKSHVEKGYAVAKASDELRGIADAILHHHERWDGSGFPDGLSHESIPLLARVLQVVDAFDHMTHHNPYRMAISVDKAKAKLRSLAGTKYDPGIVAEFLSLINDYPQMVSSDWVDLNAGKAVPASVNVSYPTDGLSEQLSFDSDDLWLESLTDFDESDGSDVEIAVVDFALYQLDNEQRIIEVNDAFTKLTGYTNEDVQEFSLTQDDLIPDEGRHEYWTKVIEANDESGAIMMEHLLVTKSKDTVPVLCYGRQYYDTINQMTRSEIAAVDMRSTSLAHALVEEVQERAERTQQMLEKALREDSTGVLNHTTFKNETQMMLVNENETVLLMILNLDRFKQYNDQMGHSKGDALVAKAAQLLLEACGTKATAGRLDGTGFAAVMPFPKEATSQEIEDAAAAIWSYVDSSMESFCGLRISMGAGTALPGSKTYEELHKAADIALLEAKGLGGARYCILFDE